jgi:hypothetical protein
MPGARGAGEDLKDSKDLKDDEDGFLGRPFMLRNRSL